MHINNPWKGLLQVEGDNIQNIEEQRGLNELLYQNTSCDLQFQNWEIRL